jgi:hypothetical protein
MKDCSGLRLSRMENLRERLVQIALDWERAFGNAPHITASISELDAALLVGMSIEDYSACMQGSTAVQRGHDFVCGGKRYQVKATRASGKPGSFITKVPKASNYEWDYLIWLRYNSLYEIEEAWLWEVDPYREQFELLTRLSPAHHRSGRQLK